MKKDIKSQLLTIFLTLEACSQTVLPDMPILIGQKQVENTVQSCSQVFNINAICQFLFCTPIKSLLPKQIVYAKPISVAKKQQNWPFLLRKEGISNSVQVHSISIWKQQVDGVLCFFSKIYEFLFQAWLKSFQIQIIEQMLLH